MVRVLATFKFKPNTLSQAKKYAEALIGETRKEDGCIQYDLLQRDSDENVFVMVEHWETKAKLDAHSASAHFNKYVPLLAELCVSAPEVVTYKSLF